MPVSAVAFVRLLTLAVVYGFSFKALSPIQCEDWTVEWDGGKAPFFMILVPTAEVPGALVYNISMQPTETSPPYRYSFPVPLPAGIQMIAVMQDATGWGTIGQSEMLTIGNSANSSCVNKDGAESWYFWTDPQPVNETTPLSFAQCQTVQVGWATAASPPVRLYAVAAGDMAWEIPIDAAAQQSRSLDWTVNLPSKSEFAIVMVDSLGRSGGKMFGNVTASTDFTCLGGAAGISSSSAPYSTSARPRTTSAAPAAAASSTVPVGTIVGAAVGGGVGLIIILVLVWLLFRRRSKSRQAGNARSTSPGGSFDAGGGHFQSTFNTTLTPTPFVTTSQTNSRPGSMTATSTTTQQQWGYGGSSSASSPGVGGPPVTPMNAVVQPFYHQDAGTAYGHPAAAQYYPDAKTPAAAHFAAGGGQSEMPPLYSTPPGVGSTGKLGYPLDTKGKY